MELTRLADGATRIDFDAFEAAISQRTRIFILCAIRTTQWGACSSAASWSGWRDLPAARCGDLRRRESTVTLYFQDIHNLPLASLAPEIAAHTITLMAPSKTWNIAGLHCAFAIVRTQELRDKLCTASKGLSNRRILWATRRHWLPIVKANPARSALLYLEANREYTV